LRLFSVPIPKDPNDALFCDTWRAIHGSHAEFREGPDHNSSRAAVSLAEGAGSTKTLSADPIRPCEAALKSFELCRSNT